MLAWLVVAGLTMAAGTLAVVSWAQQAHGLTVARTMSMVTLALFSLLFAIEVKDEQQSAFSLDTFSDKAFNITTAVSVALLILSTSLQIFHTVLKTTTLDLWQWLICTAAALSIIVAAEIRKAVRRRSSADRTNGPAETDAAVLA